jgi:predicted TIM-barrel fold metal-dependent hydrolase
MDTRGQDKVLFGTNSFGLKRCKQQLLEMALKEETKRKVLRDNAVRIFRLA